MRKVTVKLLKVKFSNSFIPNLPYCLFTLMDKYPIQIKGILDQRYKKERLINYLMNEASFHHDTLPITLAKTYKYTLRCFKNNKHITYD